MTGATGRIAGVDVGGAFTDLVLLDPATRGVQLAKVPTTPDNQAWGVLAALEAAQADPATLDLVVHGTTATTNAVLERRLSRTGLITTEGFRDVLELGRRTRPQAYGMTGEFRPVIPRDLRLEIPERMDASGDILTPSTNPPSAPPPPGFWRRAARPSSSISCTPTPTPPTSCAPARSCARSGPTPTSPSATPSSPKAGSSSAASPRPSTPPSSPSCSATSTGWPESWRPAATPATCW